MDKEPLSVAALQRALVELEAIMPHQDIPLRVYASTDVFQKFLEATPLDVMLTPELAGMKKLEVLEHPYLSNGSFLVRYRLYGIYYCPEGPKEGLRLELGPL